MTEFNVYQNLIKFLTEKDWQIICSCPPGGTDNRHRKCLLPRRDLQGSEKGPRDEVDLIARNGKSIILVECKTRLSESLQPLTRRGESDYTKLKRITQTFSPIQLSTLLRRAHGIDIPTDLMIASVLAVEKVDSDIPGDITVIEFNKSSRQIWATSGLNNLLD